MDIEEIQLPLTDQEDFEAMKEGVGWDQDQER
jgi:hypothetical protein